MATKKPTDPVEDVQPEAPAVTMADAAALNGAQPDEPDEFEWTDEPETAPAEPKPFISAGMASDLEQQGWTVSPLTGQKIVKE